MRVFLIILLLLLATPVHAAPPTVRVVRADGVLLVTWQASQIVCVYLTGQNRPDTVLDAPCKTSGAIALPDNPSTGNESIVLRTVNGDELFRVSAEAVPTLIALWHNSTLVVTVTSHDQGCLALDGVHLPQSCEVYQYRIPTRDVDSAYAPTLNSEIVFRNYQGNVVAVVVVPPRTVIALPLIGA